MFGKTPGNTYPFLIISHIIRFFKRMKKTISRMYRNNFAGKDKNFPVRLLVGALVLTGALFIGFIWQIYNAGFVQADLQKQMVKSEQLQGSILHFDEILTMSAKMSAATGDLRWEKRYYEYEPQLNSTLAQLKKLAPDEQSNQFAIQTDAANRQLVEMEKQAFQLVREGKTAQARAILQSENYERQKRVYAVGINDFVKRFSDYQNARWKAENRNSSFSVSVIFVLLVISLAAWLTLIRNLQRSRRELISSIAARRRNEEKLLKSEQRFERIAANVPGMVFQFALRPDGTTSFPFVSKGCRELYGVEPEDIIKNSSLPIDVIISADRANFDASVAESAATLNPWNWEGEIILDSGEQKCVQGASRPEKLDDGTIIWDGLLMDITPHKRIEEAKRTSEQYENLFRHANDAILIIEPDTEIVLNVNDKACEIYGLSREEFIGRSLLTMSEIMPHGKNDWNKLFHEGICDEFENVHFRADGTPFTISINASVIEYESRSAILTINRDITAAKKLEEDLRESEEHFRSVTDSAQDAIISADGKGNIISWNKGASSIFGYTKAEAIGKPLSLLMPERYREAHASRMRNFVKTGEAKIIGNIVELRGLKKGGDEFPIELSLSTWESPKGKFFTGIIRDITERKLAEDKLKNNLSLLTSTFESTADGILVIDKDDKIVDFNDKFIKMWNISGEDIRGKFNDEAIKLVLNQLKDSSEFVEKNQKLQNLAASAESTILEFNDGRVFERYSQPQQIDDKFVGRVFSFSDITERRRAEERLLHDAFHDGLTGLANRSLFMDHLRMAIERGKSRNSNLYAVLFLDFDRFKMVNDSLGHSEGDKLLRYIARRLESATRTGDLVARLGGDEFVVLLSEMVNESDAVLIAERIQKSLEKAFDLSGSEIFISASIGIALSTAGHGNAEDMLRDADIAMYRAKEKGRAQHQIFDSTMHEHAARRLSLETEMRRALEQKEFLLNYQPIISLESGRLVGFEALVRWLHPTRGMVSPGEFIPAAEDNNLILPLGAWTLEEGCRQLREWQKKIPAAVDLTMSVNLSCKQFLQSDLIEQAARTLEKTGLDPRCLKLEITESHVMENSETAVTMMNRLRALGIQLSLDDFGTGYSSLSYLHRLPVSNLKIDRSFINRVTKSAENSEIVLTIIRLAQNLKMEVVAEGIETQDQIIHLRKLGCEYGQGFFFSKPVEAAEAENLIRNFSLNFPPNLNSVQIKPELIG